MEIKAGSRWKCPSCTTEVVVVRVPEEAGELACGGTAMSSLAAAGGNASGDRPAGEHQAGETLLGKRYGHQAAGLEVLCTKAGKGGLSFNGAELEVVAAKRLPSSD